MLCNSLKTITILIAVSLILGSCSSSIDYDAGLYTKTVEGRIKATNQSSEDKVFVLVLNYHRTLLETSEGYLNRVTAFVTYPDDEGRYSASFDTDTVKLELAFFAKKHFVMNQQFHRTIGVGSYRFDVVLKQDKDWKNSYYLMIKPWLIEYIIEDRYLMSQFDKHQIGEWLAEIDEEL
jgi:hypothetical protein